jgi:uncharacterized protein (TIGR03437 family)
MRVYRILAALVSIASAFGDTVRDQRVRQDLDFAVSQILARHPNPFTQIPRSEFDRRRAELSDAIPSLTDLQAYVRLKSLIASIGDAHTDLYLSDPFYRSFSLRRFPIVPTLYDDGLFITSAASEYTRYLGYRVASINGRTSDELLEGVRPFVAFDNENWLRQQFAPMLRSPQLLWAMDLAAEPDRSTWILENRIGVQESLELEGVESLAGGVSINDPAVGYLSPTYSDLQFAYWFRYYPEQNLLFFKYNQCRERTDLPFSTFAGQLFRELDTRVVDHLVVDFRDNGGGNSEVWRPFLTGLQQRYNRLRQNPRFGFYGLISRLTFSSGMLAAEEIKRFGGARLVGEDTGGNPNSFGEVFSYRLPNSGLDGGISTRFFQAFVPGVQSPAVAADVRVYRDSADIFARFDPILFRVFALSDTDPTAGRINRSSPIVSAASFRAGSPQASRSLTTVFGDFGEVPLTAASSLPLPLSLAGLEVSVGGRPAPLLLVSRFQINFHSHRALAAEKPSKSAERNCGLAERKSLHRGIGDLHLRFRHIRSPGAILEDGSLKSVGRPAVRGSVVQIFATGYPNSISRSKLALFPRPEIYRTRSTPTVWIGQWNMEVTFSGAGPEFPGLWQINARIPDIAVIERLMPVAVSVEGWISNAVTVWVVAP